MGIRSGLKGFFKSIRRGLVGFFNCINYWMVVFLIIGIISSYGLVPAVRWYMETHGMWTHVVTIGYVHDPIHDYECLDAAAWSFIEGPAVILTLSVIAVVLFLISGRFELAGWIGVIPGVASIAFGLIWFDYLYSTWFSIEDSFVYWFKASHATISDIREPLVHLIFVLLLLVLAFGAAKLRQSKYSA